MNVCIPVLKRYDLLRDLLVSLESSTIKSDIHIIDNGRDSVRLHRALDGRTANIYVPDAAMGVAESWNWFIDNVSEERVISNDDVTFAPDSLEKLTAPKADLIWAAGCGFSCFVIRDSCIAKIGMFDESISPGYGYYEDEDYLQRLDGRGTRTPSAVAAEVECGAIHAKSQTLSTNTSAEMEEHHRKFWIAQTNYINKWNLQREFAR